MKKTFKRTTESVEGMELRSLGQAKYGLFLEQQILMGMNV